MLYCNTVQWCIYSFLICYTAEEELPVNINTEYHSSRDWLLHDIRQKSIANKFKSALARDGIVCCKTGDINRLKQWLKHGGDPVKLSVVDDMVSPLLVACMHNQTQCVKILTEYLKSGSKKYGDSLQPQSASPVFYCIVNGNIECLEYLIHNNYISIANVISICNEQLKKMNNWSVYGPSIGGKPAVQSNPKADVIKKVLEQLVHMQKQPAPMK